VLHTHGYGYYIWAICYHETLRFAPTLQRIMAGAPISIMAQQERFRNWARRYG